MTDVPLENQHSDNPPSPTPKIRPLANIAIEELLRLVLKKNASDLHITVGLPPVLRVDRKLLQAPYEIFTPTIVRRLANQILTHEQRRLLETARELDLNYFFLQKHVFRVRFFYERGSLTGQFHHVSKPVPTLTDLGLPPTVERLTHMPHSLILVAGSIWSGRNELVAAMIDAINRSRSEYIVSIEERINYFHSHTMSVVQQREIGIDTPSLSNALTGMLRQPPDVAVLDMLHDAEEMKSALALANQNCLVIASVDDSSVTSAIESFLASFPESEQETIRRELASCLYVVLCPQQVPKADGTGMIMAVEIMIGTPDMRHLIRESNLYQVQGEIERWERMGMQTMDMSLFDLYRTGTITRETALSRARNQDDMSDRIARHEESKRGPD